MKKQNFKTLLMLGLLSILAVSSASAQSNHEQQANIPFSFAIAGQIFPAGAYRITRLNPQSDQAALSIKSVDGRMSRIVLTMPVQSGKPNETAMLVFKHYGNQYFLSQVWMTADTTGLELPKSRSELTLARNIREPAPKQTAIALNPRRR
ncbi:MAG: hypothetical protein H0U54_17130 [Acidobacteria bacterium]|nr:hypothetical protein [Acidobacteriota bacterium]